MMVGSNHLNIFNSKNERDTLNLAKNFAKKLKGGEIILLNGPIGAGKTTFVKGLAKALNCKKTPISSSFNIMRVYKGKLNIRHYDLFRINKDEIYELDMYSFNSKDIIVIEWPNVAKDFYSRYPFIDISIELKKQNERIIKISWNNFYRN